jgi:hypothetical protein
VHFNVAAATDDDGDGQPTVHLVPGGLVVNAGAARGEGTADVMTDTPASPRLAGLPTPRWVPPA